MKTETLRNSFHGTEIKVRAAYPAGQGYPNTWEHLQMLITTGQATPADKARARRIRNMLCGADDCTCGVVR